MEIEVTLNLVSLYSTTHEQLKKSNTGHIGGEWTKLQ